MQRRLHARRSRRATRLPSCCTAPNPASVLRAQLHFDISPVTRRPAVLLLHGAAAGPLEFSDARIRQSSADYQDQPRRAAAVRTAVRSACWPPLVILALPPLVLGARLPRDRGVRCFCCTSCSSAPGYILIEVALIQKFVLFLGHPTYALTVIIFSMLVSSGLGSFFSRRILGKRRAS